MDNSAFFADEYTDDTFEKFSAKSKVIQDRVDYRMKLAARIHRAMVSRKLKQKDLAAMMGKSPSEISKWLSGTHNFESDTLYEIGKILGVTFLVLEEASAYQFTGKAEGNQNPMQEIRSYSALVRGAKFQLKTLVCNS
jgi:transcriptional regulator with XRE-family HTH domain